MASSRLDNYKSSNRIDPKIKRRLRRSEEWTIKRDEEVNKRRNLGPMSPCQELDVDLSMDSSLLESTAMSPPPVSAKNTVEVNKTKKTQPSTPKLPKNNKAATKVETKTKGKTKSLTEAGLERLQMLKKWKEEKELRKKHETLEKAKNKPFIIPSGPLNGKSNFERSWEQMKLKKNTKKKQVVPEAPPPRTTRAGTAAAKSAAPSQRTTRQTTSTAKPVAAPPTRARGPTTRTRAPTSAPATKAAPAPRTVPTTRATRTASTATSRKDPPKTVKAEPVRRSTRASAKSDAKKPLPSTKSRSTRNQKQKMEVEQTAEPDILEEPEEPAEEEDAIIEEKTDTTKSKTVSFAPENFVFASEELKLYDPMDFASASITLSPTSAHSFFSNSCDHIPVDVFRSSNSPLKKDFVTTRGSTLFKDETEESVTVDEPCEVVKEDSPSLDNNVDVASEAPEETSDAPSLDDNVDVPSETPEETSDAPSMDDNADVPNETPEETAASETVVQKNGEQESAASNEELSEKPSTPATATPVRVTRSSLFKTPVSEEPVTRKRTRRSVSATRPKPTRENRRRRKTETSHIPQSPEEWVELLKSSPMIEMTRKKYCKERLSTVPLNLQFDDDDLIAANIIPPRDSPSHEVDKLPEKTPLEEMESSEKIVATTPESIPEVDLLESTTVEPSVDLQPEDESLHLQLEQESFITEDEPVKMPSVDVQPEQETANTEDEPVDVQPEQETANTEDEPVKVPSVDVQPEKEDEPVKVPSVDVQPEKEDEPVKVPSVDVQPEKEDEPVKVPSVDVQPEKEDEPVKVPFVDVQPEQETANTEDEPVKMPSVDVQPEQEAVKVPTETPSTIVKHDVPYFRNLVKSHTDALNSFADEFEAIVPDVNEEVEGQIRAVVGKTKLLINKRFRQFIGYIDHCEFKTGEKETTCEDLQGFWDMIDFQVDDVRIKFEELRKSKENNWQPLENNPPVVKKPVKKLVKKVKPAAPKANKERKGRSEFALFMAQKKKEAKSKTEPDLKVFDANFFKVLSPVKSPKPHCDDIPGSPIVMPTFVETDRSVRLSPTTTIINISEDNKMDSPQKAASPEKETPQMEPKSQLPANDQSPVASPLLPTKSLRRSFLPAIPSPLLQDITPSKKGRSRKSFLFNDISSQSPKTTVTELDQKPEEEIEQEPAEKIIVLQTPPVRRSGRARTSVASYSPRRYVNKTPSQDAVMQSFIQNMLNSDSSSEGSKVSKEEENSSVSPEYPPVFTPLVDGNNHEKSTSTQKDRRRRTVEPQVTADSSSKRRRSTRISRKSLSYEEHTASDSKENDAIPIKIHLPPSSEDNKSKRGSRKPKSVAFSDKISTVAIDESPSTVLCPVSPNVESNEEQQEELIIKSGRFQTLKVGFTPVRSRSRVSSPRRRSKVEVEAGSELMDSTP